MTLDEFIAKLQTIRTDETGTYEVYLEDYETNRVGWFDVDVQARSAVKEQIRGSVAIAAKEAMILLNEVIR